MINDFDKITLKKLGLTNFNNYFRNQSSANLVSDILSNGEGVIGLNGAAMVDTGVYTGRSPKDKYIVEEPSSSDKIWWGSVNQKISEDIFDSLYNDVIDYYNTTCDSKSYVFDGFAGADPNHSLKVRIIAKKAWQAHFVHNMFICPNASELKNFEPGFTIINASDIKNKQFKNYGMNSETFIIFHMDKRVAIIGGTEYGGEMKKGIFSVLHYLLPQKGILSMHCSANVQDDNQNSAIFFGLSGTGKTTLSTDPKRSLIGDDEHGWDDDGIFNFEGGCYAKTVNLDPKKEPDIFKAIKKDALLENVIVDDNGKVDYENISLTENTRVSYPIYHINNIVKPISKAGHANKVIFLTADAFGVLPAVSILSNEEAQYHFLSGFTAKLAGTERGVDRPTPTFSACFGAAFLTLHPTKYAEVLSKRMKMNNSKAYLVNTGWNGRGERISLKNTRSIIDNILNDKIDNVPTTNIPIFNLEVPTQLNNIDSEIFDPRKSWDSNIAWENKATELAKLFIANFDQFCDSEDGKNLVKFGPQV